jgi:DNA-directed RNA polymerase subunit RPC12/RpoP
MKCANCEYEFFSQETLQRGVCPACGKSLTVKDKTVDIWKPPAGGTDAIVQLRAQVSVAVNTRRIALVLILAVVLSVGTALVSLMASIYFTDENNITNINAVHALLSAWLLFAAVIMIAGLYYIVFNKRFTKL